MTNNESNFLDFFQQFDILYTNFIDQLGEELPDAYDKMIALHEHLDSHAAYIINSADDEAEYQAEVVQFKPRQAL